MCSKCLTTMKDFGDLSEKSYFSILLCGGLTEPSPNLFHCVCYCFGALDAANEVFREHKSVPVRVAVHYFTNLLHNRFVCL